MATVRNLMLAQKINQESGNDLISFLKQSQNNTLIRAQPSPPAANPEIPPPLDKPEHGSSNRASMQDWRGEEEFFKLLYLAAVLNIPYFMVDQVSDLSPEALFKQAK